MTKILIIDDDAMFRAMLNDMLSAKGYQIFEANDGSTGLKLYQENSPDLIITDILMPEQEGLQTIREIRKKSPEVKIIALTGGGTHPDGLSYLQMAQDLGANESFPKPFRTSEFIEAIDNLVNN